MEELRFYVQPEPGRVIGPMSDDELREALRAARYAPDVRVRLSDAPPWLPARAWAALALGSIEPPPMPEGEPTASPDLSLAPAEVLDLVRFHVADREVKGGKAEVRHRSPQLGSALREAALGGGLRTTWVAPVGTADWVLARKLFDRTLTEGAAASLAGSAPDLKTQRCPICRELIQTDGDICPACDEPLAAPPASRGSFHEEPEGASWLRLHWRPIVTFGAFASLILAGITLRYVAPQRFAPEIDSRAPAGLPAKPTCESVCWTGEACQDSVCTWQKPKGVAHVPQRPGIAGPFALPPDVADVELLDDDRFAVALLSGTEIRSSRTGQSLGLVSEAGQTRKLVRAGDAIYAVGPQHIAVLDIPSTRVLKALELGGIIADVTVGANGRRALVSLPGAHAIAILSTELHAELDRIRFGDDAIGPVAVDDSGTRALTTTGSVPVAGLPDPQGGAVYAFDPSRLATEQDRNRASMLGNPVSALMSPDGATSYVVLRAKNALVGLEWLESGAVRQREPLELCDQPEQIALVRKGRRALVRCNRGHALEVIDLERNAVVKHVELSALATDLVVSPDGEQAVVALQGLRDGAIGLIDLATFEVEQVPLTEPPSRVRMSADGRQVLALSDRSKVAWVIR
ncbi:MAG: hypothetical protein JNL21_11745 [Myxococcales bacterium]|nr:hypothetical protein [Myxococcales bacterium]